MDHETTMHHLHLNFSLLIKHKDKFLYIINYIGYYLSLNIILLDKILVNFIQN